MIQTSFLGPFKYVRPPDFMLVGSSVSLLIFLANGSWNLRDETTEKFYKQVLEDVEFYRKCIQTCRFVPYKFSETKPQMVPMDLNIGFKGLALIQGQICNPEFLFERMV